MRPPPTRIGNGGRYFRTNASMGPESRSSDTPAISKSLRSNSRDRKSTRLNSSHGYISYAVFCLKKKKIHVTQNTLSKCHCLLSLDSTGDYRPATVARRVNNSYTKLLHIPLAEVKFRFSRNYCML